MQGRHGPFQLEEAGKHWFYKSVKLKFLKVISIEEQEAKRNLLCSGIKDKQTSSSFGMAGLGKL